MALPATPTDPTSASSHKLGSGCDVTAKYTGLLSFIPGATETIKLPDVAPDGIVVCTDVALQELIVTGTPLSVTMLPLCVAPKPVPLMVTLLPTDPVVAERLVMTGPGVAVELTDTLSNVNVSKVELAWLHAARPMYTLCGIVIVWLVPTWAQLTPLAEE